MGVEYALWGVFGGFAVEGLEFARAIRRCGTWPWRIPGEPGALPLAISVLIRLGVGAGLAAAGGSAHQVTGPFGALAVGVAAPLLVEQLARQIPVSGTGEAVGEAVPTVPGHRRPADDGLSGGRHAHAGPRPIHETHGDRRR